MIKKMIRKYNAIQDKKRQRKIDTEEISAFEGKESGAVNFPGQLRVEVNNLERLIKLVRHDRSIMETNEIMEELDRIVSVTESMKFRVNIYQKARGRLLGVETNVKTQTDLLEEIKSRSKGLYCDLDNNLKILENHPDYLPMVNIEGMLDNLKETKTQINVLEEILKAYCNKQ
jgi:hypothetical protein